MSKIKSLKLSNFKFFKEEETINLDGKHLLLYGENGSGKSSVFWGLYTLLESSMKTVPETEKYFKSLANSDESLVNIFASELSCITTKKAHYNSYIELEDDNNVKRHLSLLDSSICGDTKAKESRKATDFINYQAIFKFQEFKNSETPDLYKVFCYSILPYVTFSPFTLKGKVLSNANDMWKEYNIGPGTTTNRKGDTIQVYKHSQDYIDFLSFERHFDGELASLIDFINNKAFDMMKKLGYNIGFKLEYTSPTHSKRNKLYIPTSFQVVLCITHYNGKIVTVRKPHTFLNEAKMAAVATAIRLLILNHRVNTAAADALNVLVLDDVMISLDMSNRDRLMDLLLAEYSNKYQILFLTHDKSLYNFVDHKIKQHKQDNDWLRKEMYIGEYEVTKQEVPIIIDGECESLEKAKKFFKAKDYTTTAVYIRQTIEKIFSNAVPDEVKRKIDKKMKDKFIPLNNTWQQVNEIHKNIPKAVQDLFDQSKLMILNPSAHNQRLSQPIYRRELQDAFRLVDELQKLNLQPDILLVEKGKRIVFKHPKENYSFEFELIKDLVRNCITGDNDPKCKIHTWQYNGTEFYDFSTGMVNNSYASSTPLFSRLKLGLFTLPLTPIVDENCFLDNTTIEIGTLREALK
jgi:ABC-type lipoprotein export system ATPase subunit